MRGSEFEFDGVNFLYYDFNKISINRGGSHIDSPQWLKIHVEKYMLLINQNII